MTNKLYADRDCEAMASHYTAHVSAMTGEGLHSKSDIAAELAHRDVVIEGLLGALHSILSVKPQHGMNPSARMSDPDEMKVGWNVHMIARAAIAKAAGEVA